MNPFVRTLALCEPNDAVRVAAAGAEGARPDWMEPFARTIDATKKYVVSSTLDRSKRLAKSVRFAQEPLALLPLENRR